MFGINIVNASYRFKDWGIKYLLRGLAAGYLSTGYKPGMLEAAWEALKS